MWPHKGSTTPACPEALTEGQGQASAVGAMPEDTAAVLKAAQAHGCPTRTPTRGPSLLAHSPHPGLPALASAARLGPSRKPAQPSTCRRLTVPVCSNVTPASQVTRGRPAPSLDSALSPPSSGPASALHTSSLQARLAHSPPASSCPHPSSPSWGPRLLPNPRRS